MRGPLRSLVGAMAIAAAGSLGCGGGGTGGSTPTPSPTPQPAANPCASVSAADEPSSAGRRLTSSSKREGVWGDAGWSWLDPVTTHHEHEARRLRALESGGRDAAGTRDEASGGRDTDVGELAVLEDAGDLILLANRFDLSNRGLRFSPNGGGYGVAPADATFRSTLGSRLSLTDDDSAPSTVAFPFPIYGRSLTAAFVNSDGNITFGESDTASTARNVTRLLSGPVRVAPFFADLDPSVGGSVWVNAASDAFTVTYCNVPGFDSTSRVTAQTALLPDGAIEVKFGDVGLADAIVGLSPGQTTAYSPVDLTSASTSGAGTAVAERFSASRDIDLVAVSRRFLGVHPDAYDQLVVWTDQRVITGAFSYEISVRNDITGLGLDEFDESADYGATGQLSSIVMMDALAKFPDDPTTAFLGENNALSVIGQEVGHRWLAFMRFGDVNRQVSDALLGRDLAHWSFFMDSDASVMEGNDIEDRGGGTFRTVGAVNRYSRLDQYAMGLLGENDVPAFFYVASPVNTSPAVSGPSAAPRIGVTFSGTRREVRLQDVIDVLGPRRPSVTSSPKVWRQAFVYVIGRGATAGADQLSKLDRFRREWEAFYARAVDNRGRVETRLRPLT